MDAFRLLLEFRLSQALHCQKKIAGTSDSKSLGYALQLSDAGSMACSHMKSDED